MPYSVALHLRTSTSLLTSKGEKPQEKEVRRQESGDRSQKSGVRSQKKTARRPSADGSACPAYRIPDSTFEISDQGRLRDFKKRNSSLPGIPQALTN